MSWLFRRRIRLIPGVRLNVSKSGLSASVGIRGASVTLGGRGGTYTNVGIPGTGLYSRTRVGGGKSKTVYQTDEEDFESRNLEELSSGSPDEEFISADPLDITSEGLQALQEAVIAANRQRSELKVDLSSIKTSILTTRCLKVLSQITLLYFIVPSIKRGLNKNLSAMKQASIDVIDAIRNSVVDLELDMSEEAECAYQDVIPTFRALCRSAFIWDITSSMDIDRVRSRSAAEQEIQRYPTCLKEKELYGIKSSYKAMCFENKNGADLYFYPGFVVMYESPEKLGILETNNLEIDYQETKFVETEAMPPDSQQISEVWEKSNKDGSRDKRYSENRKFPVMGYGIITLESSTGINEVYMFSNSRSAEKFVQIINEFKDLV